MRVTGIAEKWHGWVRKGGKETEVKGRAAANHLISLREE